VRWLPRNKMTWETQRCTSVKRDQFSAWLTSITLLNFLSSIAPLVALKLASVQLSIASLPLMISVHSIQLRAISTARQQRNHLNKPQLILMKFITRPPEVTQDLWRSKRCAQFHALLERTFLRSMATNAILKSTPIFRDRGFTQRTPRLLQFVSSPQSQWPRFNPMTTLSHFLSARECGPSSLNQTSQDTSAEFAQMWPFRRMLLSQENEKL